MNTALQQDNQAWMEAALSAIGVNIEQLTIELPETLVTFASSPENASIDDLNALLIAAEKQIDDGHIGITLARQMPRQFSLYSYLLSHARTLGEFLQISSCYYATLMRNALIKVDV